MREGRLWTAAAIAAAVLPAALLAGCSRESENITQGPKPAAVSFAGKIDPRFVGAWTSTDSNSKIEMLKDGSANLVTITRSPYGKLVDKVSGKWLVSGSDLLFDYSDKAHDMIVVKYGASVSGKSMTLSQAAGRIKTKYKKS